jgi:hypothetical protein
MGSPYCFAFFFAKAPPMNETIYTQHTIHNSQSTSHSKKLSRILTYNTYAKDGGSGAFFEFPVKLELENKLESGPRLRVKARSYEQIIAI